MFCSEDIATNFENFASGASTGIFDLLHTGIALMSPQGNFLYCNRAFIQMFKLPKNIVGRHITEFFLTGEQGVMSSIRTKQMVLYSSMTTTNAQGVSFRYPVMDSHGELRGVIVESIPTSISKEKLLTLVETVRNLEQQTSYLEQQNSKKNYRLHTFEDIIGESKIIEDMRYKGLRFAQSPEPILVTGESGTGKELVAQALHLASQRRSMPFVSVNCAALPHELMESELFGYEAGAFTGARSKGAKGKFEMADNGTIFLDEIGELPLFMQAKLLRALESGEIQKLGHTGAPIYSDFRLITATNRNLAQLVRDGKFREDLYHRLNIFELHIPPLRNRKEDLYLLTRHFIQQIIGNERAQQIQLSPDVYALFLRHPWYGNVRELKNVLTYSLYNMSEDNSELQVEHLPERFITAATSDSDQSGIKPDVSAASGSEAAGNAPKTAEKSSPAAANGEFLRAAENQARRDAIVEALTKARYNKSLAAKQLGISRNSLYRFMHIYNLMD